MSGLEETDMAAPTQTGFSDPNAGDRFALHFTPAEWRHVLEHTAFLSDIDNRYLPPRRLMGVEVIIVPDHGFG
jgi:hypothetical protein